jgi:hypothetical protein
MYYAERLLPRGCLGRRSLLCGCHRIDKEMKSYDFRLLIHCDKIENSAVALQSATGSDGME